MNLININTQGTINTSWQLKNDLNYTNKSDIPARKFRFCKPQSTYQGIEVLCTFDEFSHSESEIRNHMKASQILKIASKIIDSDIKTAVERKIQINRPVKFVINNFISGHVTLDVRSSYKDFNYFEWTRRILPKKNDSKHFGSFYFFVNDTDSAGLYIKSRVDNNLTSTYAKMTNSTPEGVGQYLKKVFLRSIDKLDITNLYRAK